MISWIQRTFQQHFKVVFSVLLFVTIVSFIMTIGASPGIGTAGTKTLKRTFFGRDLERQSTSNYLFGDSSLSAQLQMGFAGLDSSQLQEYGMQRLAALSLADQLRIPAATKDEIATYIKNLRAFAGSDGQFDASRYAAFRDNLRTNPRLSEDDVARVLGDDVRISRVRQLLGGPGYVLPGEVKYQLSAADSSWTLTIASADYAAFKPDIPVPQDALDRFFTDNAFRYVVPPRVGVDYVDYRADDFLGAVKVTDAEVRAYYDGNRARFPSPAEKKAADKKPGDTAAAPADNPEADFAAVRPAVEQALKLERAQRLATKAAADLTVAIYDDRLKPHTPDFDALLATRKLTLKSAPPFDRNAVPKDLGWTPQIVDQALQLDANRPVSDPLPSTGGCVVLFWRETLPSYQPTLVQIRDRVVADFVENERRKLFVETGRKVRGDLEAALKSGQTFEQAAAAIKALPLTVKALAPFVARQPPKEVEQFDIGSVVNLQSGQISDFQVTENQGALIYVKERKEPDLSESSAQFAAMRAQIARLNASYGQNLALGEIVARELKKGTPPGVTP